MSKSCHQFVNLKQIRLCCKHFTLAQSTLPPKLINSKADCEPHSTGCQYLPFYSYNFRSIQASYSRPSILQDVMCSKTSCCHIWWIPFSTLSKLKLNYKQYSINKHGRWQFSKCLPDLVSFNFFHFYYFNLFNKTS